MFADSQKERANVKILTPDLLRAIKNEKIKESQDRYDNELINYLTPWFRTIIINMDRKYIVKITRQRTNHGNKNNCLSLLKKTNNKNSNSYNQKAHAKQYSNVPNTTKSAII